MNAIEKFWSLVVPTPGCWGWRGATLPTGYGYLYADGKRHYAHRLAWELANHTAVPAGMVVMHACDNPRCTRADHLTLGTQRDNLADCKAKGRARTSKVPHDTIRAIRAEYENGATQSTIAQRHGLSRRNISHIVTGHTWSHVR
jgi:hypothetical protein